MVFVLRLQPHAVFSCEGDELVHVARVPLYQGLAGTSVSLTTLDGRWALGVTTAGTAGLRVTGWAAQARSMRLCRQKGRVAFTGSAPAPCQLPQPLRSPSRSAPLAGCCACRWRTW